MLKLKFGNKEYKIKFALMPTTKSGIIKKMVGFRSQDEGDSIQAMLELIPEMTLVGLQKFHRDEFGYDYDTGEGKQAQLDRLYDLIDDYYDNPDNDDLFTVLQDEMMTDSFLAKMFRKEAEEQKKAENKAEQ